MYTAASACTSSATGIESLPATLAAHPVIQPVQQMDDGWKQLVLTEAKKPYFTRLLEFLNQEIAKKQVCAIAVTWTFVMTAGSF